MIISTFLQCHFDFQDVCREHVVAAESNRGRIMKAERTNHTVKTYAMIYDCCTDGISIFGTHQY